MSSKQSFLGESTHSVDPKHRVFVPKRFQNTLTPDDDGNRVVFLTPGFERCLFLFSQAQFDTAVEKLRTQAFSGAQVRTMQRMFFGRSHETSLDGSGRVVLPEKLRKLAGLGKEVTMIGVGDRAEIWDSAAWTEFEEQALPEYDSLDAVFSGEVNANGAGGGAA
ncbi:MAG: MraZ protein [Planctomycetota bacterium]